MNLIVRRVCLCNTTAPGRVIGPFSVCGERAEPPAARAARPVPPLTRAEPGLTAPCLQLRHRCLGATSRPRGCQGSYLITSAGVAPDAQPVGIHACWCRSTRAASARGGGREGSEAGGPALGGGWRRPVCCSEGRPWPSWVQCSCSPADGAAAPFRDRLRPRGLWGVSLAGEPEAVVSGICNIQSSWVKEQMCR